ncbi:unnamed protein product, partial [Symbiodinium microadriaticum]
ADRQRGLFWVRGKRLPANEKKQDFGTVVRWFGAKDLWLYPQGEAALQNVMRQRGRSSIGTISGQENPAELGTKPLTGQRMRELLYLLGASADDHEEYGLEDYKISVDKEILIRSALYDKCRENEAMERALKEAFFCWHQTVLNMGASESSAPPDHATVDRVVKMATKDAVEKATVNQLWEKWEKDAESKGEQLPDYVPLWWPWTRFWYGRARPPRWVEGATIVHEDDSGQLWETHVDVRLHEGRRSFVHNWTRKKICWNSFAGCDGIGVPSSPAAELSNLSVAPQYKSGFAWSIRWAAWSPHSPPLGLQKKEYENVDADVAHQLGTFVTKSFKESQDRSSCLSCSTRPKSYIKSLTVYERDPSDRRYRMTVDLDHDRDSSQLA